jgi:hypothetical protein
VCPRVSVRPPAFAGQKTDGIKGRSRPSRPKCAHGPQTQVRQLGHRRQQPAAELAPDHRGGLRHVLHRRQPVEAGHQRVLEGRRDRERRQRARQRVAVALVAQEAGLEHRPRQLLDEQWHAVGPGQDLRQHLGRQRLAGHPADHRAALLATQPAKREQGRVPVPGPRRREPGPGRDQRQHRQQLHPLGHAADQLKGRRVGPVDVLVEGQHRALGRQPGELVEQDLEGALLPLLRAEV